jgi:hypothetical protein
MSQGPNWERSRRGLVPRRRGGIGKPARQGLSFLPPVAYAPLRAILERHKLGALPVLLCLCRLSGSELKRCAVRGSSLVLLDEEGLEQARWPLDEELVRPVAETLATLEQTATRLSDLLTKRVTCELRRCMAPEHPWVVHLRVTIGLLHRLGDAAAVAALRDRPDALRAWRRSPWAHAEDIEPLTTEAVASAYDEAEAAFWQRVAGLLSDDDCRVLGALSREDPT